MMSAVPALAFFAQFALYLTPKRVEFRLHLGKTQIKLGFSLNLHYICSEIVICVSI